MLGLPLQVQIEQSPDACLTITETIELEGCGEDGPFCGKVHCLTLCAYCDVLELTPCTDTDHLNIMLRAAAAVRAGFGRRPTADTVLDTIKQLYPDTTPIIRQVVEGTIYVDIGRPFTAIEIKFLRFFTSLIPVGFGVNVKFVIAC
jgi:hypothetical protein